MAGLV